MSSYHSTLLLKENFMCDWKRGAGKLVRVSRLADLTHICQQWRVPVTPCSWRLITLILMVSSVKPLIHNLGMPPSILGLTMHVNHQCNIKKDSFIRSPVELTLSRQAETWSPCEASVLETGRAQNHGVYRWFQEVPVSSLGFLPEFSFKFYKHLLSTHHARHHTRPWETIEIKMSRLFFLVEKLSK